MVSVAVLGGGKAAACWAGTTKAVVEFFTFLKQKKAYDHRKINCMLSVWAIQLFYCPCFQPGPCMRACNPCDRPVRSRFQGVWFQKLFFNYHIECLDNNLSIKQKLIIKLICQQMAIRERNLLRLISS